MFDKSIPTSLLRLFQRTVYLGALLSGCGAMPSELDESGQGAASAPDTGVLQEALQSTIAKKVDWHVLLSETGTAVKADHAALKSEYSLSVLNGYDSNGSSRYTVLWDRIVRTQRLVVGKTSTDFQTDHDQNRADGYIPTFVDAHRVGNSVRFSGIYEKVSNPPATILRYNMTSAVLDTRNAEYTPTGYKLSHLAGYDSNGTQLFVGIWSKASSPAVTYRVGLTQTDFQAQRESLGDEGKTLVQVDSYYVGGVQRFAGIWHSQGAGETRVYALSNSKDTISRRISNSKYRGFRPITLTSASTGSSQRFASIWRQDYFPAGEERDIDAAMQQALTDHDVRGLTIAVSRDGLLKYAHGYGVADEDNTPMTADNTIRFASVSKPLTASAIMRLVQLGELTLNTRVFGNNGVLGNSHRPPSGYPARVASLTIDHFLTHTTGGWGHDYKKAHDVADTIDLQPNLSRADHISWVIANQPLDHDPGDDHDYSNFGFEVLTHVIEVITGDSYEVAVKDLLGLDSNQTLVSPADGVLAPNEVSYFFGDREVNFFDDNFPRAAGASNWTGRPLDFLEFMRQVDGNNSFPDILSAATRTTMLTRSAVCQAAGCSYARGWRDKAGRYEHGGFLFGQKSLLVMADDGMGWSIATNDIAADSDDRINLWDIINELKAVMQPADWGTHDFNRLDSLWESVME